MKSNYAKEKFEVKDGVVILLNLIENRSMPYLSRGTCKAFILINWFQMMGFIYNNQGTKPMSDEVSIFMGNIFNISRVTYIIQLYGVPILSIVVFAIMMLILLTFYYIVLGQILVKIYAPQYYDAYFVDSPFFKRLVDNFSVFLQCFLFILYIPFVEMCYGMSVCGQFTFFSAYRDPATCTTFPVIYQLVGYIGLILTVILGSLLVYCQRSFCFLDQNYLRKKFHNVQLLQLILRTLVVIFFNSAGSSGVVLKHICAHLLALSLIVEFILNFPIKDKEIGDFYYNFCIVGEVIFIVASLWEVLGILPDFDMFYYVVLFITLFIKIGGSIQDIFYWRFMLINLDQTNPSASLDILLEELIILNNNYHKLQDQQSILVLNGIFQAHYKVCKNKNCFCTNQDLYILDKETEKINQTALIKCISQIFTIAIKQGQMTLNQDSLDYLSLKFITFQSVYEQNYILTYFNLQSNLLKKENRTLYFKGITIFMQSNLRLLIKKSKEISQEESDYSRKDQFGVDSYQVMETQKDQLLVLLKDCLKLKQDYLKKLYKGYRSLDDLNDVVFVFQLQVQKLESYLDQFTEQIKSKNSLTVYLLKIKQCFDICVLNYINNSHKSEKIFNEIKKRDSYKDEVEINAVNIVNKNSIIVTVSFLAQKNKIVSPITELLAGFFGYSQMELEKNNLINNFMPDIIGNIHEIIINNYLNRVAVNHEQGVKQGAQPNYKSLFANSKSGMSFPFVFYSDNVFPQFDDFLIGGIIIKTQKMNKFILVDSEANIFSCTEPFFNFMYQNQKQSEDQSNNMSVDKVVNSNLGIFIENIVQDIRRCFLEGDIENTAIFQLPYSWERFENLYSKKASDYINQNIQVGSTESANPRGLQLLSECKFHPQIAVLLNYSKKVFRINYEMKKVEIYLNKEGDKLRYVQFEIKSFKLLENKQRKKKEKQVEKQRDKQVSKDSNLKSYEDGQEQVQEREESSFENVTIDNLNLDNKEEEGEIQEEAYQESSLAQQVSQNSNNNQNQFGDQEQDKDQASIAASVSMESVNQMQMLSNLIKTKQTPHLIKTLYIIEFMKLFIYLMFNISFLLAIQNNLSLLNNIQSNLITTNNMDSKYILCLETFQQIQLYNTNVRTRSPNNFDYEKAFIKNYQQKWKEITSIQMDNIFQYNLNSYNTVVLTQKVNELYFNEFINTINDILFEVSQYTQDDYSNTQLMFYRYNFFDQNMANFLSVTQQLNAAIKIDTNNQVSLINSLCLLSNILSLIIFIFLQFTSFPIYKQILAKLENFFIAGTRLTTCECELEMCIVESSLLLMEDNNESFVQVDFTQLTNYFYQAKSEPDFLQDLHIKKLLNTQIKQRDLLLKDQGRESQSNDSKKLLSDKIYDSTLKKTAVFLSYAMSLIVVTALFCAMLITQLNGLSTLTTKFNDSIYYMQNFRALSLLPVTANSFIYNFWANPTYRGMQQNYTLLTFPNKMSYQIYTQQNLLLSQQFVQIVGETSESQFQPPVIQNIFQVLRNNICWFLKTQGNDNLGPANFANNPLYYSQCQVLWQKTLVNGLISTGQNFVAFFFSVNVLNYGQLLMQSTSLQASKIIVQQYFSLPEMREMFLLHNYLINSYYMLIQNIIQNSSLIISALQSNLYIILIIGILVYTIVFLFAFAMAVNKLKSKYLASIFLIQVLPYVKINTDKVIQAHLKNLKSFVEKD